jgi:proteic killer suppression protein
LTLVPIRDTVQYDPDVPSSSLKAPVSGQRASKVPADKLLRIADVLAHLDTALHPMDLDLPGYRLHPLKGDQKGHWSVSISGNWRIVFRFENGDVFDVDLVDYH